MLWLSSLSGFCDALIFTFLEGFKPVYEQWGFGTIQLFAWMSLGPEYGIPWIVPMIFTVLVAIANVHALPSHHQRVANASQYAIYQSSINYQTAAYGPYAASATDGNDLARDFMAGVAALYSTPLNKNIPSRPVQYASTVLSCLAVLVTIPIYSVNWRGPQVRAESKFAQSLEETREERERGRGGRVVWRG